MTFRHDLADVVKQSTEGRREEGDSTYKCVGNRKDTRMDASRTLSAAVGCQLSVGKSGCRTFSDWLPIRFLRHMEWEASPGPKVSNLNWLRSFYRIAVLQLVHCYVHSEIDLLLRSPSTYRCFTGPALLIARSLHRPQAVRLNRFRDQPGRAAGDTEVHLRVS